MDYFQGVVTDYLRAKRSRFVNTEYLINMDVGGSYKKGRHWYCDVVAIDFQDAVVHLCEVSYSRTLQALRGRLQSWSENWEGLVASIRRDSALDERWTVLPHVFVPRALIPRLDSFLPALSRPANDALAMPAPLVTALEDVVPWKYRSWDGTPIEDVASEARQPETEVLRLLSEGGGYVAFGRPVGTGWEFRVQARNDVDDDDDVARVGPGVSEAPQPRTPVYSDVVEALDNTNTDWPLLTPDFVDRLFKDRVLAAAERFFLAQPSAQAARSAPRWHALRERFGRDEAR